MYVYCLPRGVKRQAIVKEIFMFALWSLESEIIGKWSQIYTLDVINFKFNILFGDSVL